MDGKYDPGTSIGDHQIFIEGDDIPEFLGSNVSEMEIINAADEVLDFIRYVSNLSNCVPDILYFTINERYVPVPTAVATKFYEFCKKSSDPNRGMQVILKALYAGISPEKVLQVFEAEEQKNPPSISVDDLFVALSFAATLNRAAESLKRATTAVGELSDAMQSMAYAAKDTPMLVPWRAAEEKYKMIEKVRRHRARKGRKRR